MNKKDLESKGKTFHPYNYYEMVRKPFLISMYHCIFHESGHGPNIVHKLFITEKSKEDFFFL